MTGLQKDTGHILGRHRKPDGAWVSRLADGAVMADPGQG